MTKYALWEERFARLETENRELRAEVERLRGALAEITDGDAVYDGVAKFMAIAKTALER